MSNKLTRMARELLEIEEDIRFRFDYTKKKKPDIDHFYLYTFEQIWGSTALGFGGIGGQALTEANTYVFIPEGIDQKCFVYFAGRFAYSVDCTETFMADVQKKNMASVSMSGKYRIKE